MACTLLWSRRDGNDVVRDGNCLCEPALVRVFDEADEVVVSEEVALDARDVHLSARCEPHAISRNNVRGPLRRHSVAVRATSIAARTSGASGSVAGLNR